METKKTLEQKIDFIGTQKMLRIERWRDKENREQYMSWRAGIEWYSQDLYEFICEYPTINECLDKIIDYMNSKKGIANRNKHYKDLFIFNH